MARAAWRTDPLRLAFGLWAILALAVGVRTLVRPTQHSVFPLFAASATHWWADQPLYEYRPPMDLFRYPPVFAVLVTPFSALGPTAGGILWSFTSIAVFLGGMWCFLRDVAPGRWTRLRQAAFLALAALGALRGLWNNQSNALVVGLLLLAASALARAAQSEEGIPGPHTRRRWWRAAVLLALPVCLKLTPLAPALLLCALWPRRLAGRFAIAVAAGFLVPFLTRPSAIVFGHYADWVSHLVHSGGDRWLGFRDGWTFWLAVRHLIGGLGGQLAVCHPIDAPAYRVLQTSGGLAALAWCLWQRRRARQLGLGAGWVVHVTLAAGLAWLMLFGPAVEHATYVFLAPPLVWAVVQHEAWSRGRVLIAAAYLCVMGLGWGAVARTGISAWPEGGPLLLAALPLGSALFLLWLVGYAASCGPRIVPVALLADAEEGTRRDEWAAPLAEYQPTRPRRSPSPLRAKG